MATTKLSLMDRVPEFTGEELLPVVQNGGSKAATVQDLAEFTAPLVPILGPVQDLADAAQASAAQAVEHADAAAEAAGAAAAAAKAIANRDYGALSEDPTSRPDGTPSEIGDTYFNGVLRETRRFDGANWVAAINPSDASQVAFLSAGPGAVSRTLQDKNRELVSPQDKGAAANGTTDDAAAIKAAGKLGAVIVPPGTYLSRSVALEQAAFLFGNGALKQDTQDKNILVVCDMQNVNRLIEGIKLLGLNIGPMPNASNDNWAAIDLAASKGAIAALLNITDVWTGIRNSYRLGGVRSRDSLILGCMIENAKQFGIENLYPDYARIVGNAIHNNGTAVGGHGIRIAGTNQGSVVVGNSIRDRSGPGISLQLGAYNAVIVGDYFENVVSGIQANATQTIDGRHVLVGLVIKNSQFKGVDLTWMSECLVQALVDQAADVGFDTSTNPLEGKHRIDGIARQTGKSGLRLRSDKNLATVVVDGCGDVPAMVAGNHNMVIVVAADSAVNNTVYVPGNDNLIIMIESGTGQVGLRIDGTGNTVLGRITGVTSVTGSNNTLSGVFGGNVIIAANANNNTLAGVPLGTVTDSGAGNNLRGLRGAVTGGSISGTTDGAGRITITHGCFRTPALVLANVRMSNAYQAKAISYQSATAVLEVRDSAAAGAVVANTAVTIDWQASV